MKKILLSLWLVSISIVGNLSAAAEDKICKKSKALQGSMIIQHENDDCSETYEEVSNDGWRVHCTLWKKNGNAYCQNYWPNTFFNDDYPFQGEEAMKLFLELQRKYKARLQNSKD